jgi:Mg2+ and Co2+ transporter CorA
LENHISTLKTFNDTLKAQLEEARKNKEDLKEQLKSNDENQLLRITDLKEEISVLRNELTNKNDTIKNLTNITESQLKGYKLIEAPAAKNHGGDFGDIFGFLFYNEILKDCSKWFEIRVIELF